MTATSTPRPDRSAAVKEKIRGVSQHLFARDGFDATGIRDIAAEAGVNPAIIIRHFGSKERLFVETLDAKTSWAHALEGPLDDLGKRLVRALMSGQGALHVFGATVRASGRSDVRAYLQASFAEKLVAPLAEMLDAPDAELRAHLFAAQVAGMMFALSVYDDEYLISAPAEAIVELYGDSLQRTATG